jgi:hypothetical protein
MIASGVVTGANWAGWEFLFTELVWVAESIAVTALGDWGR